MKTTSCSSFESSPVAQLQLLQETPAFDCFSVLSIPPLLVFTACSSTMKSLRLLSRSTRNLSLRPSSSTSTCLSIRPSNAHRLAPVAYRPLTTTPYRSKGLYPDSSDPKPPKTEPTSKFHSSTEPAPISESEYHEIADEYLNKLVLTLEEKAEASDGLEVEYAVSSSLCQPYLPLLITILPRPAS